LVPLWQFLFHRSKHDKLKAEVLSTDFSLLLSLPTRPFHLHLTAPMPSPLQPTRRRFLQQTGLAAAASLFLPSALPALATAQAAPKEMLVYFGTYTKDSKSKGIYLYRMDMTTGALRPVATTEGLINPSFLATDRQRRYLYAVNEVMDFGGKPGGAISAFSVDAASGKLSPLNHRSTQGGAPCHVTVSQDGKFVLVANYMGGNVTVFPVQPDGSLGAAVENVQHKGKGANAKRQEAPHAHNVVLDPANRFAFVSDLGIDKVMVYRFDGATGKLQPHATPAAGMKPGAGPRHFTFHPQGKYAYVINELNSTVTAFAYDAAAGKLRELQTVSTLPAGFSGESFCADIHVSPDGKFLYGSNRGHDSIAAFAINGQTGQLTPTGHTPTGGKWPRNFTLDPSGRFLLVANQHTNNVVVYRRDAKTGKLTAAGQPVEVPAPVCVLLAPATA
jgi:6-phosphogluconolactonase